MRDSLFSVAAAMGLMFFSSSPGYGEPAAIVENVVGDGITVRIMDILDAGATIDLSEGQSVVLGYLRSCVRERIEAGRVRVGENQSVVTGGSVEREKVECQSEATVLPGGASEGAALVFRGDVGGKSESKPVLRYRAPVFVLDGAANITLRIERIDRAEAMRTFTMSGPVLDLAGINEPLSPGGRYRASVNGREVELAIDQYATSISGPLLERLVRF